MPKRVVPCLTWEVGCSKRPYQWRDMSAFIPVHLGLSNKDTCISRGSRFCIWLKCKVDQGFLLFQSADKTLGDQITLLWSHPVKNCAQLELTKREIRWYLGLESSKNTFLSAELNSNSTVAKLEVGKKPKRGFCLTGKKSQYLGANKV